MYDFQVRLMGQGGSGKSAIRLFMETGTFIEDYDPTIEDAYRKSYSVDGECYAPDVIDHSGEYEYSSYDTMLSQHAKGFIFVFSVSSLDSFTDTYQYIEKALHAKDSPKIAAILIGNKTDLDRQVTTEMGQQLADIYSLPYFETSVKLGVGVETAFFQGLRTIRDSLQPSWWQNDTSYRVLVLGNSNSGIVHFTNKLVNKNLTNNHFRFDEDSWYRKCEPESTIQYVKTPSAVFGVKGSFSAKCEMKYPQLVFVCFSHTSRKSFEALTEDFPNAYTIIVGTNYELSIKLSQKPKPQKTYFDMLPKDIMNLIMKYIANDANFASTCVRFAIQSNRFKGPFVSVNEAETYAKQHQKEYVRFSGKITKHLNLEQIHLKHLKGIRNEIFREKPKKPQKKGFFSSLFR